MKKVALLFGLALLASPFIAAAQNCTPGELDENGVVCPGTVVGPNTSATTNTQTQSGSSAFVPLAPIPGLTEGVNTTSGDMTAFLNNLYKFLIGIAAAAAVIEIIWGGLEYATQDSPGSKSNGKDRIQQAVLGLILVLMPVLVFTIINPNILNLSVNWKKIEPPVGLNNSGAGGTGGEFTGGTNGTAAANNPRIRNGATTVTEVFATNAEVQQFVTACDSSPTNFHGYYKGGLPGWFSSGSQCTQTQTVTSGSDVSTQCSTYQFTGYCSQVRPSLFLNLPQGGIFTTGYTVNVDENGTPTYSVPGNALSSGVYLDSTSQQFVSACQTDGGVLTYKDAKTTSALANCPTGNNLKAGTKCFTTPAVYCRLSN